MHDPSGKQHEVEINVFHEYFSLQSYYLLVEMIIRGIHFIGREECIILS